MVKHFFNVKERIFNEAGDFLRVLRSKEQDNFLVPPKKDHRGRLAKKIDYLAVRVLFFFMIVFVASTVLSVLLSILLAAAGTLLLHLVLDKAEKTRGIRYAEDMRDYLAGSHAYDQIMRMEPGREFKILMVQVLNRLEGFTNVRPYKVAGISEGFDLIGMFKDYPVAVCCNRYKQENEVGKSELVLFTGAMKKAGLTRGIFLTTSSFSEWAVDYVHAVKGKLHIVLADKARLLEWIRLSGHPVYPDERKIEELETMKNRKERMVSLQKREQRNKRLMHAFFMVSIYLTVLSLIMRQWLQDWMLYLYFMAAVFNLLLGFVCYAVFRQTRDVIRESYMLEHLD